MSHAEVIQKNHDVLQRCTTINLYVIDYLRAEDVLDEAQEYDLKTERNPLRQRNLLFQWLKEVSSQKYESFLKVMKETEQEHVANHLTGSTEVDHLPLSDARYQRLVKIRNKMTNVTRIDNEVIAELRSWKAITMTDADEIRVENADYAKISKLISAIMRRSNHSYNSFQEILRKTLQMAAANFLSEGEMPAVHVNNNRPDLDGILSSALNEAIRNNSEGDNDIKELLAEVNGLGVNLVKAIPGESIVIFIYCKTVQNAVKFTQLFNSGRLQYILDGILNRLLRKIEPSNKEILDSRIILEDDDIISLEEFTGIEGWMQSNSNRPKSLGKTFGRHDSTQTDEEQFMKKKTEWLSADSGMATYGSSVLSGAGTRASAYNSIVYVSAMAESRENSVQEKIAEMTFCSICAEHFTNPKILPCIHTFCLHCLKNYGKDKKPGDKMVCPICRNKFFIPDGDLCNLPNNFLIGEMVEIEKLSKAPAFEAMCDLCPEGEELVAKMYCIDCEQILCERCSKSHKRTKFSQNHPVVELGSKLNVQNFNLRSSYCDHHPKELTYIYCYDDDITICLICWVESHQSHRCVNVVKAAGDFTKRLKEDLRKVTNRLPECEEVEQKLDNYKKEFLMEISKTEKSIRDTGTKLKELVDQHTEILVNNLKSVREENLKAVDITRLDVDRFRVMTDSFSRYSEELLSRGSHVDICKAADQMHTRANELEKLPSNCNGDQFRCDIVAFQPSSFENILRQCSSNNIVGELTVTESPDRIIKFAIENTDHEQSISESATMIDVSNIPEDITEGMLRMLIENRHFGGRGEVTNIVYEKGRRSAVITLSDPEVAKTLIQKEVLIYKGNRLDITRSAEEPIEGAKQHQASLVSSRMVDVSEIPPGMTTDMLMLLLENSSDGEIESIDHNQEHGTAVATFTDSVAADVLIYDGSVVYKGKQLSVARHGKKVDERKNNLKEQPSSSNRTIFVSQILQKLNKEYLVMILENKRNGGGKIEDVDFDQEQRTAVVTFKDPKIAASFLKKGTVEFKGQRMLITKHMDEAAGSFKTFQVSGIPQNISQDVILMYFENKKRSGGGSLKLLKHQKEKGKAVIMFKNPKDGLEVCKRRHVLSGVTLKISALEMPLDDVKSCAIEVKGLRERFNEDTLALYFKNTDSNGGGGGPVENVFVNKEARSAIVVFEEAAAVLGVMKNQPHTLDGSTLEVNVLEAAPPPPLLLSDVDTNRLLVKRLPPSVTKESLREYLSPAAGAMMVGWTLGVKTSTAVLDFSSEPDYLSIRRLVCSKPFNGKMISIRRVPLTSSILVTGMPYWITADFVAMYFENPRHGCTVGECEVQMLSDKGSAIVEFELPEVVLAITSKRHQFEKKEVKVEPYYPWLCLSFASASSGKAPASLTHTFDSEAVHFILKRQELKKHIEDSLEKLNCRIEWPSEGKGEVKLEYKGKEKQKPTAGWDVECKKFLQRYADDLTWRKENVIQEIWIDFKMKILEHIANKSELDTTFENDLCGIQYIGLKKDTDEIEKVIKKLKGDLEEELERKKERISEPLKNLKPHHLDLIRTQEFQKNLRQKIPDLEFEVKQTEVNLCGTPGVVKRARLFILEKVAVAAQDSFEISEPTSRVFAKGEAKPYLMEQLHTKGISASWTCNDRSVVVYALDDKNVKEGVEVLKQEVVEVHIQVSKSSEALVQSGQWKEFIRSLCDDNKSLEVVVMGPTVVAACTRNIVDGVRKRLNGFIEKHAILEKSMPMDLGVVEVITKYMNDELRKIESELKECSGSIGTYEDEPGFIIKGNETGVAKVVKDLLKLIDGIIMYDHDIDRPGIPAYFYSKHGKEVLRGIQTSHKVSIQLDNTQERAKPKAAGGDGPEMCRVEVIPGKFMILMRGDITKCSVDAIVNASNEQLEHIGGVAAAIAEAAGPKLEEDCLSRIKLEGRLLPGQAYVTRAGKLPCKKVIHAVGPRWSGGKKDEENILAMAVDSSLNVADNEGLKSIAMPLISTGIFGFPLDRATDIIVDAVNCYFVENSSSTVREVFFIDNDSQAVASFEKKLRTIQADERPKAKKGRRVIAGPQDYRPLQTEDSATSTIHRDDQAGATQRTRTIADPRPQIEEQREERQPQHLSRIIFSIYALSMKAIDDVLKNIEDVIKEYIIDKVLDSPKDQENIAKLNPEQVRRIKDMVSIFPVQIEVETGQLKRIRIRGPPMEVTLVIDQVHNIFQEAHNKAIKRMEEEWIANEVQWEYEDEGDFEMYPDEINAIIERAYRDKKSYAEWEAENAKYRLTFQTMVEEFMTKPGTPPVKVRRVSKGKLEESFRGESPVADPCVIEVQGIPDTATATVVTMIFENKRCCGIGDVEVAQVEMLERGRALLTIKEPQHAKALIERVRISYKSHTFVISRPSKPDPVEEFKESAQHPFSHKDANETPGGNAAGKEQSISDGATIDVSNIPEAMDEDTLKMIIENKRFGGGGEVTNIVYEKGQGSAVITLSDPEVAKRLVRQASLVFKGSRLMITKHIEEDRIQKPVLQRKRSEKEQPFISDRMIKVSNIPSDVNKETLEMIFENKRNGGGETENILYDQRKGIAVITYKDPEVAKTLIQKEAMIYKGNRLAITTSAEEPIEAAKQDQASSVSSRMVDISEIPPEMTTEMLTMLLENSSDGDIETIDHDQNHNTAVATFTDSVVAASFIKREVVEYKGQRMLITKHEDQVADAGRGEDSDDNN